MKKKLLVVATVLVVGLVAAFAVARHVALGYLTPDFVVQTIESRWNCRAELDALDVSLGATTVIKLEGLRLSPRDQFATGAVPLADREPAVTGPPSVSIGSAQIKVRPGDLLKRHLNIEHLVADQVDVVTGLGENGRAQVDSLFDPPVVSADAAVAVVDTTEDGEPVLSDEEEDEVKISTEAALVEIDNSSVTIELPKGDTLIKVENLHVVLKDIDVDPSQLLGHNSANFDLTGTVAIEALETPQRFLELKVRGNGIVAPFDTVTGKVQPSWNAEMVFLQGSKVETFPLVDTLKEKLADIDTGGVDLSDLNLKGELALDAGTRMAQRQGRYTLEQPVEFLLPDTLLSLEPGSWIDTTTNEHELHGRVTASEELTAQIVGKVDEYLEGKIGGLVSADLRQQVLGLALSDGQISVEFVSNGDISEPKVDVVTPFGTLGGLKETFDGLKDALKGLFGD